jgi:hypothetical protein
MYIVILLSSIMSIEPPCPTEPKYLYNLKNGDRTIKNLGDDLSRRIESESVLSGIKLH